MGTGWGDGRGTYSGWIAGRLAGSSNGWLEGSVFEGRGG